MAQPMTFPPLSPEPLVSVLVASYNYAGYLPRALESATRQTYERIEVIVCDDGSTDGSADIAERLAETDARVSVIRKPNGGVASALNAAFAASSGELVCLLDADDVYAPEKVAAVVACARARPNAGLIVHRMIVVDAAERPIRTLDVEPAVDGWIAEEVLRRAGRWRAAPASALTLRRGLADRLFPLPESALRSVADGYLLMLAPLLAEVAGVPDAGALYRLHGSNLTGAARFSAAQSARMLEGMERLSQTANAWLAAHDAERRQFQLQRHVNHAEHTLWHALMEATVEMAQLKRFCRLVWADDLYGAGRKAVGFLASLGALVVPRRWRASWLTFWLGESTLRRWRGGLRDPRA